MSEIDKPVRKTYPTNRERDEEIERLRRSLDDHLESEAAETRRADRERDRARLAEAEIERLRGLLLEVWNWSIGGPTGVSSDLFERVREALDDE